jgi:hypothetical protein
MVIKLLKHYQWTEVLVLLDDVLVGETLWWVRVGAVSWIHSVAS